MCAINFMTMDAQGVLYFGSYSAILTITPDGTTRRVAGTALAGRLSPHSNGDGGPALNAEIGASGIALDAQGNMFISCCSARFWRRRQLFGRTTKLRKSSWISARKLPRS